VWLRLANKNRAQKQTNRCENGPLRQVLKGSIVDDGEESTYQYSSCVSTAEMSDDTLYAATNEVPPG
jgi:hypothetical protein